MGRVYLPSGPLRRYRLQDTPEPVRPRGLGRANVALGVGLWLAFTAMLYWLSSADGWQARADDALSGKRIAAGSGSRTMLGAMPGLLPTLEPRPPQKSASSAPIVITSSSDTSSSDTSSSDTSSSDEPAAEERSAAESRTDEAEGDALSQASNELEPLRAEEQPPLVLRGVPLRTVVRGARRGTPMDPVFARADDAVASARRPEPRAPAPPPSAPAAIASAPALPSAPEPKPIEFPPAPWEVASLPKPKAATPLARPIQAPAPAPSASVERPSRPPEQAPAAKPAAPARSADARGLPTCEAARERQRQEIDLSRARGPGRDGWQDRAREQLADGSYFTHCALSARTALTLCTAVEQGRVVGVTVTTVPASSRVDACVRNAVAGLRFTASPEIDVFTTYFAPVR
jgi:hypothetical protein